MTLFVQKNIQQTTTIITQLMHSIHFSEDSEDIIRMKDISGSNEKENELQKQDNMRKIRRFNRLFQKKHTILMTWEEDDKYSTIDKMQVKNSDAVHECDDEDVQILKMNSKHCEKGLDR